MSFPSTTPKVMVLGPFGNTNDSADKEFTIFYTQYCPIEITKVYVTDDVGSAADNTNYLTLTLESGTTNTGGTELFSANTDNTATGEGAITVGVPFALTETEGTVAQSRYITFTINENAGSALATDMMLIIYYVEGSPASE